jgi:uncharacterized protein (TIGR02285 family)
MEKNSRCPTRVCLFLLYQFGWMNTYMDNSVGSRNLSWLSRGGGRGILFPESTAFYKSAIYGMLYLVLCLTISVCEATYSRASDDDTIIWLRSHYPPYYITKGPNAGNGIADRIEKMLQKELMGYMHVSKEANWKRVMQMMKAGEKVVSLTLLKTPDREKFIEYSVLTSVKPTNGICVRSDDSRFEGINEISFNGLLNMKSFKIGVMRGRSYGKGIDQLLKKNANNENIVVRSSPDGVNGLFKMQMIRRIDAVVCYPHETNWVISQFDLLHKVKQLRVLEQNHLNYSYSGAPKTKWGKEIIAKINKIYTMHNILKKTSIDLEPYLDETTMQWYRKEAESLHSRN